MHRLTLIILGLLTAATVSGQGNAYLRISEVQTRNVSGLVDEYGARPGWIEILNTSWETIDVGGCYLTTDPSVTDKRLSAFQREQRMSLISRGDPRTKLGPKRAIVFYADGQTNKGTLHLNFKLHPGRACFVALYDGNGEELLDSVTVPAQLQTNHSWAAMSPITHWAPRWIDCPPQRVTPAVINSTSNQVKTKVEEFKEQDPYGVAMALMGMGIVFACLTLLYLCFQLFSYLMTRNSRCSKTSPAAQPLSQGDYPSPEVQAVITLALSQTDATMAVIALALRDYLDIHDQESGVITITPRNSPWTDRSGEILRRKLNP